MGKDLVEASPEAATLFDQADSILGNDFKSVCFEGPEEKLTDTSYCQPALFVHGLALLEILKKEKPDLTFDTTAGLSLGEFTAHTAAGHFTFEDGLKLVAERGRLMAAACSATSGGMIALVGAKPEQAMQVAEASGLQVANYNCPGQIVLSGEQDKVPAGVDAAKEAGIRRAIPLKVAGAYHSSLMQSAQDGLKPHMDGVTINESSIATLSNVKADFVNDEATIRQTLLDQVTGSVRWEGCVEKMIESGVERFIELGPGKVLQGFSKKINPDVPCLTAGNVEELKGLINEL